MLLQICKFLLHTAMLVSIMFCTQQRLIAQGNVRLTGHVYDSESQSPLPGVNIHVKNTIYGTVSDAEGSYQIENVPPGEYTVVFSLLGYVEENKEDVFIKADLPSQLSVGLEPRPLEADSVVVISDKYPAVNSIEGERIEITGKDIERYQSLGLAQLLHQVAGVQIESVSGGAGRSIIRIHGSSANQVLVLLDGQRLNNPQTGEVDLSEIPLEQIERIEVVRQGNTAIFGGNAFGGVISFKSRRVENQNNFSLRSQYGSFNSALGNATINYGTEKWGMIANYQQDYSRQDFHYRYQGETEQRENAWYRNRKLFAKTNLRADDHRLNLRFHLRRGKRGLPSAFFEEQNHFNAFTEAESKAIQLHHRWFMSSNGYIDGSLNYHRIAQLYNNEEAASAITRYKTQQENTTLEGKIESYLSVMELLQTRFGIHYLEERLAQQNLLFAEHSIGQQQRASKAAYGSFELNLPPISPLIKMARVRSALRYEAHFRQTGNWYPLVGISFVPGFMSALNLSASWAKAIRYPDFNSLFWKGDARAQGNPNLLPEQKSLWNISARLRPVQSYLPSVNLYYYSEEITDLIFWHRTVRGIWEPRNEARAEKRGLDVELENQFFSDHFQLRSAYSFIDAINKNAEPNRFNRQIVFIPQHAINSSAWFRVGPISSIVVHRFISERETVPANTEGNHLNSYNLWNISVAYQQTIGRWKIQTHLSLKNIASTQYELLRGYPMPGRHVSLSVALAHRF